MTLISQHPAWIALDEHARTQAGVTLSDLFAEDPARGTTLIAEAEGIYFDYSKQRITSETLRLLFALAEAANLAGRTASMFDGEKINNTEGRAVLHTALRQPEGASVLVDGKDVEPEIHEVLRRMGVFERWVFDTAESRCRFLGRRGHVSTSVTTWTPTARRTRGLSGRAAGSPRPPRYRRSQGPDLTGRWS